MSEITKNDEINVEPVAGDVNTLEIPEFLDRRGEPVAETFEGEATEGFVQTPEEAN